MHGGMEVDGDEPNSLHFIEQTLQEQEYFLFLDMLVHV